MGSEYKVGTISQVLAKAAGGKPQKIDPKLAALFGNASSKNSPAKVFRTVKVTESQIFHKKNASDNNNSKEKQFKRINNPKVNVKLKHKDAAAIRVNAKNKVVANEVAASKITATVTEEASAKANKKKNKKKKKVNNANKVAEVPKVQDETISSATAPDTKQKSKNKRKRKLANEPKVKKAKKSKTAKVEQESDENDDAVDVKIKTEDLEINQEKEIDDEKKPETVSSSGNMKTLAERNAPKSKDPELEARTIFVGNLPKTVLKKQLRRIFNEFGNIETVRFRCAAPNKPTALKKVAVNKKELHPDNDTLAAYIRYRTCEEAEVAVQKAKGLIINEHHLVVDSAVKSKRDNKRAIFVGNLHLKLTDEELWRFFEDCGKIESVRVIRDGATGMGKGFGYVNFEDRDAVEQALKKNQELLKNRNIRISRHVKKLKVKKEPMAKGKKGSRPSGQRPRSDGGGSNAKAGAGNKKFDKNRSFKPTSFKGKNETSDYSGDRLAEIGKLKRKSKKPNRGEIRKAKIAKLLTKPSVKVNTNYKAQKPTTTKTTNTKRYFN